MIDTVSVREREKVEDAIAVSHTRLSNTHYMILLS